LISLLQLNVFRVVFGEIREELKMKKMGLMKKSGFHRFNFDFLIGSLHLPLSFFASFTVCIFRFICRFHFRFIYRFIFHFISRFIYRFVIGGDCASNCFP